MISTLLVIAILTFTVMTIKKRNDHPKMSFLYKDHPESLKKGQLNISNPLQPWTTNADVQDAFPNLIRSNAWFDTLQR